MSQRYEAHIFCWWLHHQFGGVNTEQPRKDDDMTRFQDVCLKYGVSERYARRIVNSYLSIFKGEHGVDYDMGRDPGAELLEAHYFLKQQHGRGVRPVVLEQMKQWHDDTAFRRAVERKLPPASPFTRRQRLSDLLRR